MRYVVPLIACVMLFHSACQPNRAIAGGNASPPPPERSAEAESTAATAPDSTDSDASIASGKYAWLEGVANADLVPLATRFPAPKGYQRVQVSSDSFGEFLRRLPVYREKRAVKSYDGRTIHAPSAAVIALDVGDRDLQQCADTAIRLHAEYLWSSGQRDEIAYHFTSGDLSTWSDWAAGERFQIRGSRVERMRSAPASDNRETFRRYLEHTFMYAGTRSLRHDSRPAKSIGPGTFFVAPGSPGHAVIVLDVARNEEGKRIALLGQGFMPAQQMHILRGNTPEALEGVWWRLPTVNETLDTPSWSPFDRHDARQFTTSESDSDG